MYAEDTAGAILTTSPHTGAVYAPRLSLVTIPSRPERTARATPETGRRPEGVLSYTTPEIMYAGPGPGTGGGGGGQLNDAAHVESRDAVIDDSRSHAAIASAAAASVAIMTRI